VSDSVESVAQGLGEGRNRLGLFSKSVTDSISISNCEMLQIARNKLTSEEVADKSKAGRIAVFPTVFILADSGTTVIGHRDVVVRIVGRLESAEAGVECVLNEEEGGVVVEDVRVARSALVLQMQEVVEVADEPSGTCRIDD